MVRKMIFVTVIGARKVFFSHRHCGKLVFSSVIARTKKHKVQITGGWWIRQNVSASVIKPGPGGVWT